jgi:hypothetical protein
MIQRLVVDLGLEHAFAAEISEAMLDRKRLTLCRWDS